MARRAPGAVVVCVVLSSIVAGCSPPSEAPLIIDVKPGDRSATVTWSPVDAGSRDGPIQGYRVMALQADAGVVVPAAATQATVHALENGATYRFTVAAWNMWGEGPASAPSFPVTPARPPQPPTAVTATPGDGMVTVAWAAPVDTGGLPLTGFIVKNLRTGATIAESGSSRGTVVTQLINGLAYSFTVSSGNAMGLSEPSQPSNEVTPIGVPWAPTNLVAVAGNHQVSLTWSPPDSNGGSPVTGYVVFFDPWSRMTVTTESATVTGLVNGLGYNFLVGAINERGAGVPALVVAMPFRPDGGVPDAGPPATTIREAKARVFPASVDLQGVVVTAVSSARLAFPPECAGTTSAGAFADFWVADPADPTQGIFVQKNRCDRDLEFQPRVGDVLRIVGMIGLEPAYTQRTAWRTQVRSESPYIFGKPTGWTCELTSSPPCEPLEITRTGTTTPLAPVVRPTSFADGGELQAERELQGARIELQGPLTVAELNPPELRRVSALGAADPRYFGFRLSNGVLVADLRIYGGAVQADGGLSTCDVRGIIGDGGTFSFPNGLRGVWDTYSFAPCTDGGTTLNACTLGRASVPGMTDANYTNVLYPMGCDDLMQ